MHHPHKYEEGQSERGAALLIAIFALLLISVVGIAMIVSTGTDSALTGNYRTSTSAYYAALAGLEEARGRLLWKNPDYFDGPTSPNPGFMPMAGVLPAMQLTDVRYILNPASGETVDPTSANPANYPDTEYAQEFPWGLSGSAVQEIPSVSAVAGLPGPSYKWVRINPITEQSLNLDVDSNGVLDGAGALFYDPAHVNSFNPTQPAPGLVVSAPSTPPTQPTPTSVQALEITSLAVSPSGSRRLLQYVVAPYLVSTQPSTPPTGPPNINFPGALTLAGNNVSFVGPGTTSFFVDSQDHWTGTRCSPANYMASSIGFTNSGDSSKFKIVTGAASQPANYLGFPPTGPPPPPPQQPSISPNSLQDVSLSIRPNWLTPAGLDAVVQDITKSADVVFNGSTNANTSLTPLVVGMTPPGGNPMTIVVNGDLDFNAWHHTGYGLLLVTGTLKYDPDASWQGLVLVIGQGTFVSTKSGSGEFDGAVFVAKTRDASNNLLPTLGPASFSQTGGGGNLGLGIRYYSCLVNSAGAQAPLTYKVLSFREIPLAN